MNDPIPAREDFTGRDLSIYAMGMDFTDDKDGLQGESSGVDARVLLKLN